jgi:hypothetical protein
MDRFIPTFIAIAMLLTGVSALIWPAGVAVQSRDDQGDTAPASRAEVWQMRVVGLLLIAGSLYFLYAILMNLPGAEFNGV